MQALLEIIGSTIIGGMLLLLILTSKTNVNRSANAQTINSNVQGNLTSITEIIEYDLKNLGYRQLNDTTAGVQKILTADSNKITFNVYNDATSNRDSISYYYNTADSTLNRKLNGTNYKINLGVKGFNIKYYTLLGALTTVKDSIKSFKVAITVLDTFKYDGDPVGAYWEKTFKPQNL
jgi:hypothetical protein